jgi:hypothetical protein
MNTFNLGTLGEHSPKVPSSLAIIFELVTSWSEQPDRTKLGFICAAAIAHSVDHPKKPRHKTAMSILDYGRDCIEWLLGAGVPIPDIYSYGSLVLALSMEKLPTQKGVDEKADFLSQPEGDNLNT